MPRSTPQPASIGLQIEQPYFLSATIPDTTDLDISTDSRSLRSDIRGCDPFVRLDANTGVLVVSGGGELRRRIQLRELRNSRPKFLDDCDQSACLLDEECDSAEPKCSARIHSQFTLNRPKRPNVAFHAENEERLVDATRDWRLLYDTLEFDLACIGPDPADLTTLAAPVLSSSLGCGLRVRPQFPDDSEAAPPVQPSRVQDPLADACGRLPAEIDGASSDLDPIAPRSAAFLPVRCNPAEAVGIDLEFESNLVWDNDPRCNALVLMELRRSPYAAPESNLAAPLSATIQLEHADAVATPETLLGVDVPITCTHDDECKAIASNFACSPETFTCGLNLEGRPASNERPIAWDSATRRQSLQLNSYTYCRGVDPLENFLPKSRRFHTWLRVDSSAINQPFPDLSVPTRLEFKRTTTGSQDDPPLAAVASAQLCLPAWYAPRVFLPIAGSGSINRAPTVAAVELWTENQCCDNQCSQQNDEGVSALCTPQLDIRFRAPARLNSVQRTEWASMNCALPDEHNIIGQFTRKLNCDEDSSSCGVFLPADADPVADCIEFDIEHRSPATSVYRSRYLERAISSCDYQHRPADSLHPLDLSELLQPRVILHAQVTCADELGDACDPSSAVLMAERLQEQPSVQQAGIASRLGPYFFHQRARPLKSGATNRGYFALPVEPGIYAVTVLQAAGELGGPSGFRILDLRDQGRSPLVRTNPITGVFETLGDDPSMEFVLEPGIPVRVDLQDGFDRDVKVLPLDVGTHPEMQGNHACRALGKADGCLLDLNDPATCYPSERGCTIRSLIPPTHVDDSDSDGVRFDGSVTDFGQLASFTQREAGTHGCP